MHSCRYMIQLLHMAGATNVIAAASPAHTDYLLSIGATTVLDYRRPDLAKRISEVSGGTVHYAVDPIGNDTSIKTLIDVVKAGAKVAILLPLKVGGQEGLVGAGGSSTLAYELSEHLHFATGVNVELTRTFLYETVSGCFVWTMLAF